MNWCIEPKFSMNVSQEEHGFVSCPFHKLAIGENRLMHRLPLHSPEPNNSSAITLLVFYQSSLLFLFTYPIWKSSRDDGEASETMNIIMGYIKKCRLLTIISAGTGWSSYCTVKILLSKSISKCSIHTSGFKNQFQIRLSIID